MRQYLDLCKKVMNNGTWFLNERTGVDCLTLINADLVYDCRYFKLPVLTTKKVNWKAAIAEFLGYIRGYQNSESFSQIGCNTWHANANENEAWLANSYRTGKGDMGRVYGVQGRGWISPQGKKIDQLASVVEHLSAGIDDRGEIISFWNVGELDQGCLRPCMHTHTFSIVGDMLYLTSYQRSNDLPLGQPFNQIQVAWFLMVMAQITGLKPGYAYHKIVNVHIYKNQLNLMRAQLTRAAFVTPTLRINPAIKTLDDLESWVTVDDFKLENYKHHSAIKYPFSV